MNVIKRLTCKLLGHSQLHKDGLGWARCIRCGEGWPVVNKSEPSDPKLTVSYSLGEQCLQNKGDDD